MRGRILLLVIFTVLSYPLLHELGHCITSFAYSNEVIEVNYNYIVTKESNLNLIERTIFKSAGLTLTFYPSLLAFIYFWTRKSQYWVIPYTVMTLSTSGSTKDFYDICILLDAAGVIQYLDLILMSLSFIMIVPFFYQIHKDKIITT